MNWHDIGTAILAGALLYPPLTPFDEHEKNTFDLTGEPCKTGDCVTVDRKAILEAGQRLYEMGKHEAQVRCGSRT